LRHTDPRGKPATIVLDNGQIHASQATRAASAERKPWLTPAWMAEHAPEPNAIEDEGKTLKADHLAHATIKNRDDLKIAIATAIEAINSTRKSHPLAKRRIFA
jgi:transposase